MNYLVEYCNFECTICGEVCPTGAILPLTVEDKKLEQTGQVTFILEKCVVYTDNTACGSCSEHCTQAVRIVPYRIICHSETNQEICIGAEPVNLPVPLNPASIFVDGMPCTR
jgi:formate hydrogenlyase subunit 6/NADH:ubiquinone oxidoreductase subunit I